MKNEVFIVIPEPLSGLFPRLMPTLGKPIRARKYAQRYENKTFYITEVEDPENGEKKKIVVRAPECWEAEVTVTYRRKE